MSEQSEIQKAFLKPLSDLVEAAECIANNNIHPITKLPMYDIDKHWDGWKRDYIKKRIKQKQPQKASQTIDVNQRGK